MAGDDQHMGLQHEKGHDKGLGECLARLTWLQHD